MRNNSTSNYPFTCSGTFGRLIKGLLLSMAIVLFNFTQVHAQVNNATQAADNAIVGTSPNMGSEGDVDPSWYNLDNLSYGKGSDLFMAKEDVMPADNPDLSPTTLCEDLRVVLVLDESGSILTNNGVEQVRAGTMALATSFKNSAASLTITEFAAGGRVVNLGGMHVDDAYLANLHDYLYNDYNGQSYDPTLVGLGNPCPIVNTNWQDGFIVTKSSFPNLILFLTDGEPNTYNVDTDCGYVLASTPEEHSIALGNAIIEANELKLDYGTHIFAIGVTDNVNLTNLKLISGEENFAIEPDIYTADYSIGNFAALEENLTAGINSICGTTLAVTKSSDINQVCSDDQVITFTLSVENTGGLYDYTAINLVLRDTFPSDYSNLTIVGGPISGASIDGQILVYNAGDLAANESISIQVSATLSGGLGNYPNNAYAKADNATVVSGGTSIEIVAETYSTTYVSNCGDYLWPVNGETYSTGGEYIFNGTNSAGCPSADTLNLTINEPRSGEESKVACESYEWNGQLYEASGDYDHVFEGENGLCDSTATLHLTINEPAFGDQYETACGSFTWYGQTYYSTPATNPTRVFYGGNGLCDSTATLHLTINQPGNSEETVVACESYFWNGMSYTSSGDYEVDTDCGTSTLHLTINQPTSSEESAVACESYAWNGMNLTTSGDYDFVTPGENGLCDHTTTLHLTINQPTSSEESAVACESYAWNGMNLSTSGDYDFVTPGENGLCDHTTTLHLTINQPTSSEESAVACESYAWNGMNLTTSGDYDFVTPAENGLCDHTTTLHLTINQPTSSDEYAVACGSYDWNGMNLTTSGDYDFVTPGENGLCDHTTTLHLTINQPTSSDEYAVACGSYDWNGMNLVASGDYDFVTPGENGLCDHTATLHLTINEPTSSEESASACESYTWNGTTYTESGDYDFVTAGEDGFCDHTATLHLTIGGPGCNQGGEECTNFKMYYLASATPGVADGTVFEAVIAGGEVQLTQLFESGINGHMALNTHNGNIYIIHGTGTKLSTFNPAGDLLAEKVLSGLNSTYALAFDPNDGKLYAGSANANKVYKLDPATGDHVVFAQNVPVNGGDIVVEGNQVYLIERRDNASSRLYNITSGDDVFEANLTSAINGASHTDNGGIIVAKGAGSHSFFTYDIDGSNAQELAATIGGQPFTVKDGDMAGGCVETDEPVVDCENFKMYYIASGTPGVAAGTVFGAEISGGNIQLTQLFESGISGHMAVNTHNGNIYVIKLDGTQLRTFDPSGILLDDIALTGLNSTYALAFDPADGYLYVGSANANKVYKMDPSDGAHAIFAANVPVDGGDIVVDGDQVYLIERRNSGGSKLHNITSGDDVFVANIVNSVNGASQTANGGLIVAEGGATNSFWTYDFDGSNGQELMAIDAGGNPFLVVDGDMASGCIDQDNPVIDCTYSMFYTHFFNQNSSELLALTINPDNSVSSTVLANINYGSTSAAVSEAGVLYVPSRFGQGFYTAWDVSTGSQLGGNILMTDGGGNNIQEVGGATFHDGLLWVNSLTGTIYGLDPLTGVAQQELVHGHTNGSDVLFDTDNDLWLISRDAGIFYNITAGTSFGVALSDIDGIALLDNGLFAAVNGNNGSTMYEVDQNAGVLTGVTFNLGFSVRYGDLASVCITNEPVIEEGDCNATEVVDYVQGTRKNGGAIMADRTDASKALGAPERTDVVNFVTLGYEGSIILAFDGAVPNGPGDDIEVVETTFNFTTVAHYPEYADVFVSVDGIVWDFIGTVNHVDRFVDISFADPTIEYINFVKIVNNDVLSNTDDAYDLDGVVALYNCEEEVSPRPLSAGDAQSTITSYPNPTSGPSVVVFTPATTGSTLVEVYDMNGRNVATLFNQVANANQDYRLDFDGNKLPNGVYIYKMTTENEIIIDKFMIAQ